MEDRTAKSILFEMVDAVKSGKVKDLNNPQLWVNRAFELNSLLIDEIRQLEELRQRLAIKTFAVLGKQEKRNVSLAKEEEKTWDEYRELQIQEGLVEIIKEQIRLAKKNSDINHF